MANRNRGEIMKGSGRYPYFWSLQDFYRFRYKWAAELWADETDKGNAGSVQTFLELKDLMS